MPQELWFGIVLVAMCLILSSAILVMAFLQAKTNQNQAKMIQDLTNLAASKDIATYSNLHALANQAEAPSQNNEPLAFDDVSMANHLATRYAEHGIDPGLAYAKDDDPINDFGGPEAFR